MSFDLKRLYLFFLGSWFRDSIRTQPEKA